MSLLSWTFFVAPDEWKVRATKIFDRVGACCEHRDLVVDRSKMKDPNPKMIPQIRSQIVEILVRYKRSMIPPNSLEE